MTFLKNYWTSVLLYLFIIPFIILMVILGIRLVNFSGEVYQKTIELNELTKTADICNDCIKFGYTQATTYFLMALGGLLLAILLPNLQSISFGGASITLKAVKSEINDLKTQNNNIQEQIVNTKPTSELGNLTDALPREFPVQAEVIDDPQKGKWGGLSDVNGRHLRAKVNKADVPGFFTIRLTVTGDYSNPIKGLVKFHLHDSFKNANPIIAAKNNMAELNLNWVYGAFTVGVETDNGQTKLELDLAELEDAPKDFRER